MKLRYVEVSLQLMVSSFQLSASKHLGDLIRSFHQKSMSVLTMKFLFPASAKPELTETFGWWDVAIILVNKIK